MKYPQRSLENGGWTTIYWNILPLDFLSETNAKACNYPGPHMIQRVCVVVSCDASPSSTMPFPFISDQVLIYQISTKTTYWF